MSEYQFGFFLAILRQQRPCLAKAAEPGLTSGRRRAAETAERLVAMAQCVDQGAGAEPGLRQGWRQLSCAVVRSDCAADVAQLLERDSQAEICICVTRVGGDSPLQCRYGLGYPTGLQAGESEIVLNAGIRRLQKRCVAQWHDRIGWPPGSEQLSG